MKNYFNKLSRKPLLHFIVVLSLIAVLVKIPAGIFGEWLMDYLGLIDPIFSADQQTPQLTIEDMVLAIAVAPVLETFIAQLLPIEFLRRFSKNTTFLITASSSVFMVLHYPVLEFFPSAFMVGAVLAWAWCVKRHMGLWNVFVIVTVIHSLHNALVTLAAAMFLQ